MFQLFVSHAFITVYLRIHTFSYRYAHIFNNKNSTVITWIPVPFNNIQLHNICCMIFSEYNSMCDDPFDLPSMRLIKNPFIETGPNPLYLHFQPHWNLVPFEQNRTHYRAFTTLSSTRNPSINHFKMSNNMRSLRKERRENSCETDEI